MPIDPEQFVLLLIIIFDMMAVLYIVFFERRNPSNATVWVLVLVLLPFIGFVSYLVFGQHYFKQKRFAIKAQKDLERIRQLIREQKTVIGRARKEEVDGGAAFLQLVDMLLANNGAVYLRGNEVRSFVTGRDKFDALLQAIQRAKHHVHMEYYIIRDDELGRQIVSALTAKAREGVEVRLLYDVLGNDIPKEGYRELIEAGGKVSPFYKTLLPPSISLRVNYHNHRKIAVIDGTIGFVGGFNIGDEYLGKGPLGFWRDTAVEIRGEGAMALQFRFLLDWRYATKEELPIDSPYFPEAPEQGGATVQIVSGGPDSVWNPIKEEYLKLITIAKRHIYLQTPYFIPDQSVLDALRIAAMSGVDVRIMFPCKPDHPFVYWASYSYVADLLDAGVRAFAYNNGFIHAKTATVDDVVSSIGTANWDIRSFRLNFETNAVIYDPEFAVRQRQHFEDDLMLSTEVTAERYRKRSLIIRLKEGISRLFSSVL
ncbi:MAG: cardiolipin synthase [Methanomassiliicoccus sp.]|nr:cardiolipin synthase [Methanomassiliicoccus sp.]